MKIRSVVVPPHQQAVGLGPASLSKRHQALVHFATLAQIGWATDLLNVPREETFLVSSHGGCALLVLWTHTQQIDQDFRRSVVDEQEFELVQSSFRFFPFGTRQMHTSSPNWNFTCFRFRLRSSSKIRRCARVCKHTFAAPVLIFRLCSIVIGSVPSVASVFHAGRLCANIHWNGLSPLILPSSLWMLLTHDMTCPALRCGWIS